MKYFLYFNTLEEMYFVKNDNNKFLHINGLIGNNYFMSRTVEFIVDCIIYKNYNWKNLQPNYIINEFEFLTEFSIENIKVDLIEYLI